MATYKFTHLSGDKKTAFFSEVRYVDGEIKTVSPSIFKMILTEVRVFDSSMYYELFTNDDGETLTHIGARTIAIEQLIENERIRNDLEKGKSPLPLDDDQEAHNKRAFEALAQFMKRKSKKTP